MHETEEHFANPDAIFSGMGPVDSKAPVASLPKNVNPSPIRGFSP